MANVFVWTVCILSIALSIASLALFGFSGLTLNVMAISKALIGLCIFLTWIGVGLLAWILLYVSSRIFRHYWRVLQVQPVRIRRRV